MQMISHCFSADYLTQAFYSFSLDLKTNEGKTLFLQYQAVPVILGHLRISSKGLLSNVIDSLLQMTLDSSKSLNFINIKIIKVKCFSIFLMSITSHIRVKLLYISDTILFYNLMIIIIYKNLIIICNLNY